MTRAKKRSKTVNEVLGIILVIAFAFSSIAILNNADAKTVSESDAVNWMNSVNGKKLDFDNGRPKDQPYQ